MSPDVCTIIPTVRDHTCLRDYVENARSHGFPTDRLFFCLVTEDHCDTQAMADLLDELGVAGEVFAGSDREKWFNTNDVSHFSHLVPARSHAQTSFGLLYLWANDFEYGVFIDDDTLPHPENDFFGRHLRNLTESHSLDCIRSDTRWVNVLDQTGTGLYPRGFPYGAMGESTESVRRDVTDVVVSQGLWTDVPDLDAVRILMDGDLNGRSQTRLTAGDYDRSFTVGDGNYLTVCSMNLAFHRQVIPAFYQFPMDDNPWGVGRFDDIWSGVVLKRACDVLDTTILSGYPLCRHEKVPRSTFDDLAAEAAGLELNEHLWRIVDDIGGSGASYSAVSRAIASRLADGDWSSYRNGEFFNHAGEYLHDWLDCLNALTAKSIPASDD